MLNISKETDNGILKIALEGRLDTVTSPELEAEVNAIEEDVKELVMDFEQLEYISSAGLRVLLAAQKAMLGREGLLKIVHVGETIMEIFEVTGFSEILTIE